MTVKSSFNLGTTARSMELLGEIGVKPSHQQAVIDDPIRRAVVGAAYRGEIPVAKINPQDWVEREMAIGQKLAEFGFHAFDQKQVEKAAEIGVTVHHRFVPEFNKKATGRRQLLEVAGKLGIKFNGGSAQSADCDGKEISNKAGVFRFDLNELMRPSDAQHRPFNLNFDQQMVWASEQGGQGFSTVAKTLYVGVIRPWIEFGKLPYMGGSIRCQDQDAYGSDGSLGVGFFADFGLGVDFWGRSAQRWILWALPEVFQEL